MPASVVEAFGNVGVTGQMIVNGISDDDLKEMGIALGVQRRAILAVLMTLMEEMKSIFNT